MYIGYEGKGRCRSSSPSGGFLHTHSGPERVIFPYGVGVDPSRRDEPSRLRTLIVCCCAIAGHAAGAIDKYILPFLPPLPTW